MNFGLALINKDCPTVAFCGNKKTLEKILSNLQEVKARNGYVIAIAEEGMDRVYCGQKIAEYSKVWWDIGAFIIYLISIFLSSMIYYNG